MNLLKTDNRSKFKLKRITRPINNMNSQDISELIRQTDGDRKKLKIEVFRTEQVFNKLEEQWKDLAVRADATVYMSFEWMELWWRHFGRHPKRSLAIVTIWDSSKLVSLAPFYIGTSSIGSYAAESRLQLIGSGGNRNEQFGYKDDYGISDFLDILVDKEYRKSVTLLLCDKIHDLAEELNIDILNLHTIRDDSFVKKYLYPGLKDAGFGIKLKQTDTCLFVDLKNQPSLKEFIKSVKSNARRRFRQTLRAKGPEKTYQLKEVKNKEDVEQALENLIEMHQNRWNHIGFPGVFYDERFTSFFKDLTHKAFQEQWLWFKQAYDEEGVCASRMILRFNGRYYDYISGFDGQRKSSKARPGIGLLLDCVDEAIKKGAASVELLRGEEPYKYDFTSETINSWMLQIDLRENQSYIKTAARYLISVMAIFYTHIQRETELMNVQKLQKGIFKMLPGYIAFRWQSVKKKLGERKG